VPSGAVRVAAGNDPHGGLQVVLAAQPGGNDRPAVLGGLHHHVDEDRLAAGLRFLLVVEGDVQVPVRRFDQLFSHGRHIRVSRPGSATYTVIRRRRTHRRQ
jgi:hypothetical protein